MTITNIEFSVKELCDGFDAFATDEISGLGGKLHIASAYTCDAIMSGNRNERDDIVRAVMKGYPLPEMYCVEGENGTLELVTGQKVVMSICTYVDGEFSIDSKIFYNLRKDEQEKILNYKLRAYVCIGEAKEVLDWLSSSNISGIKHSAQEIRNRLYSGNWVTDAVRRFSMDRCMAWNDAREYLAGSPVNGDYLQTALTWIADREGCSVEDYMSAHRNDSNSAELWDYFMQVIGWVKKTFPVYRSLMKGIPWGILYNKYSGKEYDKDALESMIQCRLPNCPKRDMKGIYEKVLAAA
ncbi:MAG: HNH endonuclease [Clostridia bacterium]|nr:HNH endonuclease [Clostridia bacterium]